MSEMTVKKGVLQKCDYCAESIVVPKNVHKIRDYAFCSCGELCEILVDEENEYFTSIDGVLYTKDMKTLVVYPRNKQEEEYIIPDGVEVVNYLAFKGCRNLVKVTLPESMKCIKQFAFFEAGIKEMNLVCDAEISAIMELPLEKLTIADSVKTINAFMFNMCDKLETVRIPPSVEKICDCAFGHCRKLKEVIIESAATELEEHAFFTSDKVTIYAPKGSRAEEFAKEKSLNSRN